MVQIRTQNPQIETRTEVSSKTKFTRTSYCRRLLSLLFLVYIDVRFIKNPQEKSFPGLRFMPAMRSLWSSKPSSRWPQPMSRSKSWTSLGEVLHESWDVL